MAITFRFREPNEEDAEAEPVVLNWAEAPQVTMGPDGMPRFVMPGSARTKRTRGPFCGRCEAELTEADREAKKCTQCGAFYNVE